jgi:glutathione S-transferase
MALKLYYAPGACSLAAHIALEEAGLSFEVERLDLMAGQQRDPAYLALNPKGRVPFLVTDHGGLSESVAILGYIAALAPEKALLPADAWARAQAMSLLAWLSGTVHGTGFATVFRPGRFADDADAHPAIKAKGLAEVETYLDQMNARIEGRVYAFDHFTVVDPYFLILRRWGIRVGLNPARWPALTTHAERVAARPGAARAIAREGINLHS